MSRSFLSVLEVVIRVVEAGDPEALDDGDIGERPERAART